MNNHILTLILMAFSAIIFFFSLKLHLIEKQIEKINNKSVMVSGAGISEKIGEIDEEI